MDDSVIYTGVDSDGAFGNETVNEEVQEKIREQEQLLAELTPQLEEIIALITNEQDLAIKFIADTVDNIKSEAELLPELKAAARYRSYLDNLKNVFILRLNEAKK